MNPTTVHNLLHLITVLFVCIVIMMTINEFGANPLTIIFVFAVLFELLEPGQGGLGQPIAPHGGLVGMSLLDLQQYHSIVPPAELGGADTNGFQFPGWNEAGDVPGHINNIFVRIVVTMVILAYLIKSGCCKMSNLNPVKMFMM